MMWLSRKSFAFPTTHTHAQSCFSPSLGALAMLWASAASSPQAPTAGANTGTHTSGCSPRPLPPLLLTQSRRGGGGGGTGGLAP